MKNSFSRHQFRNQINRAYRNVQTHIRYAPLAMIMGVLAFGETALSFLGSLITVGAGPFAGLNRGQMRRMSWLFCMYR